MSYNPDDYNLNEISQFFGLDPNHTFTQINDAFRKKHNELTMNHTIGKEQKDAMLHFFERLKNKLVLHLSTQNVPQNEFQNGLVSVASQNNLKIDDHVDTVTNNQILYPAGSSKVINAGIMNPIERNVLKNVIHFDTRFKQNYVVESTSAKCKDTKFTFNMPTGFKNVISSKLLSFEIPATIYNITEALGNRTFTVNCVGGSVSAATDVAIKIDEGKYTKATLMAEIQQKLIAGCDSDFLVAEDNADTTFIRIRNTSNAKTFTLKFPGIKDRINLGYILGFRGQEIASVNDAANNRNNAVADHVPDMDFNNYFYLSFDDYQRSVNHNHYAVMNKNFVTKNIFAKIRNDLEDSNTDYFIKKTYFGPVTFERVSFELLDRYGNALDLKGLDYSFSVELEILYKY